LTAAITYSYVTQTQKKFYIVPWFGLIGMLVTAIFLPDTTGLDLKEQERRFHYIRMGRVEDYHGIAVPGWCLRRRGAEVGLRNMLILRFRRRIINFVRGGPVCDLRG
jgi:hypothetical protein